MGDARHKIGMMCSRYGCSRVSVVDTEMGTMCREHGGLLMCAIQMPGAPASNCFAYIPWEFAKQFDHRARMNHGGQTLARLSERGGLSPAEMYACMKNTDAWALNRAEALPDSEWLTRILLEVDAWAQKKFEERQPKGSLAPASTDAAIAELEKLSKEDRKRVFDVFCVHCGDRCPKCTCWNDE
jgi:hypothetical protein